MPLGRHQHRQLLPREEDDLRVDQGAHAKAPAECELHLGIAVSGRDIELVCVSFGGNASLRMMRWSDIGTDIGTDIGILRTQDAGLSWHDLNDGRAPRDVPRIIVSEVVLHRANNTL